MKIESQRTDYLCADGKFFTGIACSEEGVITYRQIELYLPSATGVYGEEIEVTREKWLDQLQAETRKWRWAIGSTGNQLTARYQIRESDGELVSLLSLNGGMQEGAKG